MQKIPNLEGDVRAQLDTAASGTWDLVENVSWPPEHDFNEDKYRRHIRDRLARTTGVLAWPGEGRARKLTIKVSKECGMPRDDVQKLEESAKINMLVDNERQKYITPLQKISEFTETFRGFVAHPTTLDEVSRVVKTIVAIAHGDSLLTNRHCAVVDLRVLLRRREQYLEAEKRSEIENLENFYSGPSNREGRRVEEGRKLTRTLMEAPDLPECTKVFRGRLSLLDEGDAKLNVDSLLTTTGVARGYVLRGAVRDVENTKEVAHGRVVVACLVRNEVWHVVGHPSHFAMLNPLTPHCLLTLARTVLPTLALGYRQSPSLVPPLKMVESGDGGVIVGVKPDPEVKASVKSFFPKTVEQLDRVMARAIGVIGENNITDAPARLLALRVASASSSGMLESLSRDDGLGVPKGFGVKVDALTKLIDSMKDVVDISKAVGPLGHILCSCPTPPPPQPQPPPAPQPTNVNRIDLRHGWSHTEWNGWAAEDEDGDG